MTDRAVVLAAGAGTRMRAAAETTGLSSAQQDAARRGLKAMMPAGGRPFLDYVLSGLADAGLRRVCLVIGPDHTAVQEYYRGPGQPQRISLAFAVQAEPYGTADAVLAAEPFAAGAPVVVVNGDNLYPPNALEALRRLPRAGLVGFRRTALLAGGAFPADRILAFALLAVDATGELTRIVEKPDPAAARAFGPDPLVSMNAWLLPPNIYTACRAITPSVRGELELQDAVSYARERLGERFRVVESDGEVLDLSRAADVAVVEARLPSTEPHP